MQNKSRSWIRPIAATWLSICLGPVPVPAEPEHAFRYGADERVRQEYFDHIPVKFGNGVYARQGENDYLRFRTRIWAERDLGSSATFRVRIVNESRAWLHPDVSQRPQRSTSEWPDEWVFDNLYLDVRNVWDGNLNLRIGRQELIYGSGNVIYEGTPGDGSRTLYFNAVKAIWKALPKTEVDFFALYNEPEDELAIHPANRDISGFPRAREGVTESGGGIYARNRSHPAWPVEAYAIYKRESEWEQTALRNAEGAFVQPALAWQTLDPAHGVIRHEQLDFGTIGVRVQPSFTDSLSGELELAGQFGQRDETTVRGFLANACLKQSFAKAAGKPSVKAGILCLSGDDPGTEEDEGWNPVWARHPQWSELYVFAWDTEESASRWSNLLAPSLETLITPCARWDATFRISYLHAFEDDGKGDGLSRGWLARWRNDFRFKENWLIAKDRLTGHLMAEALDPGNYYPTDETAVFVRWEFNYAF